METKQFQNLLESIINLNEDHMKGKTVIVNGKRGVVGKEVSQDGETEGDEFYRVKFEDGTTKNIPARDMEISGDTKNKKQPGENEAEDIVKESVELEEKKKKKGKHDCATHVEHTQYGEGQCIHSKHATPDENGQIAWYDVMFEHGVEKGVPTDSLKILVSEVHEDHEPEEGENLDELKKSTLGSYINKAAGSIKRSGYESGRAGQRFKDADDTMNAAAPNPTRRNVRQLAARAKNTAIRDYRKTERITKKRQSGIQRAVKKLGEASSMVYGKYKAQNTGKQDRHGFDKYDVSKGDKVISRGKTERQATQKLNRVRQLQQKKANIKLKLGEGSLNELDKKTLRSYATKARTQITRDLYTDQGKHKPSTNRRAKGLMKAKERLGEDYQCPKELQKYNMKGAGVGIPAINNNVFGTNGFKSNKKNAIKEAVKIKLNPATKIGHEITAVGPGGKKTVTNRQDMPGKPDVRSSKK